MTSRFLSITAVISISTLHRYVSTFFYENCNEHLNNIYSFGANIAEGSWRSNVINYCNWFSADSSYGLKLMANKTLFLPTNITLWYNICFVVFQFSWCAQHYKAIFVIPVKVIIECSNRSNTYNLRSFAHKVHLYTLFNKNQAAWYFVRPAQAVTWRTVAIIIRVVFNFPIFVNSWRFSVFQSLQSITPRIY